MGSTSYWAPFLAVAAAYGVMQFFTKFGRTRTMKSLGGLLIIITVTMILYGIGHSVVEL